MTAYRRLVNLVRVARLYERAYGLRFADLDEQDIVCDVCGAGWVGYVDDPCDWCARALERQRQWQREMLLAVPDCNQGDADYYSGVISAWLQRLYRAVESGLVTRHEADAARSREKAARVA